jgi:hypothetical protein
MFVDHFAEHVTLTRHRPPLLGLAQSRDDSTAREQPRCLCRPSRERHERDLRYRNFDFFIACRQTRGSPCPLTKMVLPGGLVVCT